MRSKIFYLTEIQVTAVLTQEPSGVSRVIRYFGFVLPVPRLDQLIADGRKGYRITVCIVIVEL